MADIGSGLSWFETLHDHGWVDGAESIDDNLTFDRLNGIYDNTNSLRVQHLLGFLCLNISARQPATETRMRVIPANTDLVSSDLFHHVHEFLLVYWINRLNTDSGTTLWHREHIYYVDGVVIMDLADHEAHDFERNTSPRVLQHLKERQ